MASLLSSTLNPRSVLPGSLRCLRSDAIAAPTEEDVCWLLGHGITTLIDLRSDAECVRKPCPLADHSDFQYRRLPVTGGNAMPDSPADVPRSYAAMVDAQMPRIIAAIDDAPAGVVFFCTAGKDRTGVVSALLQKRAGLSREEIIRDYLLSGENLRERLEYYGRQHPEIDPDIYFPQRAHMEGFLDWLESR